MPNSRRPWGVAAMSGLLLLPLSASGQNAVQQLGEGITYRVTGQVTAGTKYSPTWLNANKYGLSSVKGNNGYLEASIERGVDRDSLRNWRIGFGVDLAVAYGFTKTFIPQQIYADFRYKKVGISAGAKQRQPNLKDPDLSTGSQTFGINARPIPDVRFEIPDYISITGKSNWAAIRGHFGYGMMTDGRWKGEYLPPGSTYVSRILYHSKSGFLRLGNEDKFPLVFEGGLEMACQFGGVQYTFDKNGHRKQTNLYNGLKDFVTVAYGGGSDPGEGIYANATGNTVGSWLLSLSYKLPNGMKVRAYYDHFFEDHSMMFWQYGWRDGLIGGELTLPKNAWVDKLVYEYVYTKYQSGPIYHDHTSAIPDQISATDNYYNHGFYTGWEHWGQPIGNPLFRSPLYRNDGTLNFTNNRFIAHHVGIKGSLPQQLRYRLLYTYTSNWGTYGSPYDDVKYGNSFLAELSWAPLRLGRVNLQGWQLTGAFALDRGSQTGRNTGVQFTISKSGLLTKR